MPDMALVLSEVEILKVVDVFGDSLDLIICFFARCLQPIGDCFTFELLAEA